MLLELAPQRALSDPGLRRERAQAAFPEFTALYARQHLGDQGRQIPALGRRQLGATAQAGAQPVLLRRRREAKIAHVVLVRRPRGADGAAIDAGGQHAGEEAAVETRVSREPGGMALLAGEAGDDLVPGGFM